MELPAFLRPATAGPGYNAPVAGRRRHQWQPQPQARDASNVSSDASLQAQIAALTAEVQSLQRMIAGYSATPSAYNPVPSPYNPMPAAYNAAPAAYSPYPGPTLPAGLQAAPPPPALAPPPPPPPPALAPPPPPAPLPPAPAPVAQTPAAPAGLPALQTVAITADEQAAPIDTSSPEAAVKSAATWVHDTFPEFFNKGDDRPTAMAMMSKTIGALRAHGFDAYRVVNYADRPVGDAGRYGKDALVLNGRVWDCYLAWGDPNGGKPQALNVGVWDESRAKSAHE